MVGTPARQLPRRWLEREPFVGISPFARNEFDLQLPLECDFDKEAKILGELNKQ